MIYDSYKKIDTSKNDENLKAIYEVFSTKEGKKALQILADVYIDKTGKLFGENSGGNVNLPLHLSYIAGQERVINLINYLTKSYEDLCRMKNN